MDIQGFINDYNKYTTKIDLMAKYDLTDYMYNQVLKQYNLNRGKCHKSLRIFNISNTNNNLQNININASHIPIEKSYKVEKIIKNPVVEVVKTKSKSKPKHNKYDDIMQNAMNILNDSKKTLNNKEIM